MPTRVIPMTEKVVGRYQDTAHRPFLEAFKFDCQVRNLTPTTIDCYMERLDYLLRYLDDNNIGLTSIDRRIIQDYIMHLKGTVSDETINGRIRVYRRFFNFLVEDGLWETVSPMAGVKILRTAKRVKPVVEPEMVQQIIKSIDRSTFEGNRNFVLVLLLWDGMLRKKELLGLKATDTDKRLIRVFGKGRKERMVPIGVKALKALHQYLIKWRSKYPGDHLICMRNGEPLTDRRCHKIVQDIGKKHGVKLHPHLLRHSAATWYIRQGGNPAVLQGIMGHTSLLVTQNYLHLSSQDAVNSYDQFSPSNCLKV